MNRFYKIIKYLLYTIFIIGIIIGFVLEKRYPGEFIKILFTISLSGLIGLGTNTVAIKMLFRPLRKTFFGRQGLLPKNKEKIANTIAKSVRERILNEETISSWIKDEEIIEKRVKNLIESIKNYMSKEENQQKIREQIKKFYDSPQKDRFLKTINDFLLKIIEDYWTSHSLSFYKIYNQTRELIAKEREKNNIIIERATALIKEIIIRFVKNNSSEIASIINKKIDDYIDRQGFISSLLMSIGRAFFVDEEKVEKFVVKSINDKKSLKEFGDTFEKLLPEIDNVMNDREIREMSRELFESSKAALFLYIKTKKMEDLMKYIEKTIEELFEDKNRFNEMFSKIEKLIFKFIEIGFEKINDYLKSSNLNKILTDFKIGESIENIVRENILKQDLEEFEKLMMKIMGENLAFIEILGGILGILIGIGIHYKIALIIIPAVLLFLITLDNILTKIFKNKMD